jgi:hypothetical protein
MGEDCPRQTRLVREFSDSSVRHKRFKCMICQALSPQLDRGGTRTAEMRDAFVRAHAPRSCSACATDGTRRVQGGTRRECCAAEEDEETHSRVVDAVHCIFATVVAASGRLAGNVIHSAMELAQAACLGRAGAKSGDLLPQMDRKAMARESTAAADTQFGGAANLLR